MILWPNCTAAKGLWSLHSTCPRALTVVLSSVRCVWCCFVTLRALSPKLDSQSCRSQSLLGYVSAPCVSMLVFKTQARMQWVPHAGEVLSGQWMGQVGQHNSGNRHDWSLRKQQQQQTLCKPNLKTQPGSQNSSKNSMSGPVPELEEKAGDVAHGGAGIPPSCLLSWKRVPGSITSHAHFCFPYLVLSSFKTGSWDFCLSCFDFCSAQCLIPCRHLLCTRACLVWIELSSRMRDLVETLKHYIHIL